MPVFTAFTANQINTVTWQETVNKCSDVRLHSAGHHLSEWLIEGVCKKLLKLSTSVKQQKKKSIRTPLSWSVVLLWKTQRQIKDIFSNLPGSCCKMKAFYFFPHWIIASINKMASAVRTESNMQQFSHAFHHPWGFKCILVQPLVKDHCYWEINFCCSPG